MFRNMDESLTPAGRGKGGDLIQLMVEQCQEMGVPHGSWYRGGIVVLPGHPKGFVSKGHPKGVGKKEKVKEEISVLSSLVKMWRPEKYWTTDCAVIHG